MGLFKSEEEKRQKQIEKLEKKIQGYIDTGYNTKSYDYEKLFPAIEELEKLVGTENLNQKNLLYLVKHYAHDEKAMERLYPEYSRRFCNFILSIIDDEKDSRNLLYIYMIYLQGSEIEPDVYAVATPNLDLVMERAQQRILLERENGIAPGDCFGQLLFELACGLKKENYPAGAILWEDRFYWLRGLTGNPAAQYLYLHMLSCSRQPLTWKDYEREQVYENLMKQDTVFSEHLKRKEAEEDGDGTV